MKLIAFTCFSIFCLIAASCNNTSKMSNTSNLNGNWRLISMPGAAADFNSLFPETKPTANIDLEKKNIGGKGGCNGYGGPIVVTGNKVDLTGPIISTKMYCVSGSEGENKYFNLLPQVNTYTVTDNKLYFNAGSKSLLVFEKLP